MSNRKFCSNPLNKKNHKCVNKNIKVVNKNWSNVFSNLISKYICDSCRRLIASSKVPVKLVENASPEITMLENTSPEKSDNIFSDIDLSSDDEQNDASYHFEESEKKKNLVEFQDVIPRKRKRCFSYMSDEYLAEIKVALEKSLTKIDKMKILTTLPRDCSVRKISRELGVSRRVASNAKKLRDSYDYGFGPDKKKRRRTIRRSFRKSRSVLYVR